MTLKRPELISFWIKTFDPHGPLGYGVTAWSLEDAIGLIRLAGYSIDLDEVTVSEDVHPHQVDDRHIAPNSGPSTFRGVWYPCLNIGWGASGTWGRMPVRYCGGRLAGGCNLRDSPECWHL